MGLVAVTPGWGFLRQVLEVTEPFDEPNDLSQGAVMCKAPLHEIGLPGEGQVTLTAGVFYNAVVTGSSGISPLVE